jgi:hypothetical protein
VLLLEGVGRAFKSVKGTLLTYLPTRPDQAEPGIWIVKTDRIELKRPGKAGPEPEIIYRVG